MLQRASKSFFESNKKFNQYKSILTKSVTFGGVGVHSGQPVTMEVSQAEQGSGIAFVRTDISGHPRIPAKWHNVDETRFSTRLNYGGATISTVEHILAALAACNLYDVIIKIDGAEVPIMDGSSADFINAFMGCMQETTQLSPLLYVEQPVRVENEYGWASLTPAPSPSFAVTIDQANRLGKKFGIQQATFDWAHENIADMMNARTYGTYDEGLALQKMGLALGANIDNTIVINNEAIMNADGLRSPNEMARHKILDAIGDLALSGHLIVGLYQGYNAGHTLNNMLLRKLFG